MSKKRITLLHGWGGSVYKLRDLADELSRNGWEVYFPPLPGFGAPSRKKAWDLDEYASHVFKKAEKHFGRKRFFIFGHSFGGRIAIKIAARNNRLLSGIVLCASAGISRPNPLKRFFFFLLARLGKILIHSKSSAGFARRLLYKLAREKDYQKTKGVMRETFKKVVSEDLKPLLPKIKIPVLVLWGEEDRMTPVSDAYYLRENIIYSDLIVFKNEGHRLPYNRPKQIAANIEKWFSTLN